MNVTFGGSYCDNCGDDPAPIYTVPPRLCFCSVQCATESMSADERISFTRGTSVNMFRRDYDAPSLSSSSAQE